MTDAPNPWQPLAGLRLLDFSLLLPGPFATVTLADLGAEFDLPYTTVVYWCRKV